ncbi:MAG: AAA-like domain-containing protein [Deltaproteobacteria bacterium]|nr:AAA-like domain-containing protein [Deltaproteobacteria bacterium]
MRPYFNIAGPCIPGEHYLLPPERRLAHVREHIEEGRYFVLQAGRQTGKTTSMQWLTEHLNARGDHAAAWVDLQTAREQPDPGAAFRTLLGAFERALARDLPGVPRPSPGAVEAWLRDPASALLNYLQAVSAAAPRPVVLLLDEVDGLVGAPLVSFLTQLREGYIARRGTPFPWSVALVGACAVRDYALSREERRAVAWLGTASPFNVASETATLEPFTRDEVSELLGQHTEATGQAFDAAAVERVWALSQGHPWLVNALADQAARRDVRDRAVTVTAAHIDAAREALITERRTHLDSLAARLREPRVQRILAPMLAGETTAPDVLDDDFAYVVGLGLLRYQGGHYVVANPIYREVIPRALTHVRQAQLPQETAWFLREDGALDMPGLFTAWQAFWRKDGHLAAEGFGYREAGPHLMLMAFLQRVVNGGGTLEREYALGKGALDLCVGWRGERHAIEVKLRRDTDTEAEALPQVTRYLDSLGLTEGWLVLFDLRQTVPWEQRLFRRSVVRGGHQVHVVGC